MSHPPSSPAKGDLTHQFQKLTQHLKHLIIEQKLPTHSDSEKIFSLFQEAEVKKQRAFLDKLKFYISLIEMAKIEKIEVLRNKRFLWNAFKKINVIPPSDLFEMIKSGDFIEVYDPQGVQLFASFELMSTLSYSIEEVYWYPFEELFERAPNHTEAIMTGFELCFTTAKGPFTPAVEEHMVWETMSIGKKRAMIKYKMFAPIFGSDHKAKAMVATSDIRLLP